jgi:putative hydrolase of the HAD superfamily
MIKAIIFDLWNTLIYNNTNKNPFKLTGSKLGIENRSDWKIEICKALMLKKYPSVEEAVKDMMRYFKKTDKKLEKYLVEIWKKESFALFDDVENVLRDLKGRYNLALASNTQSFSGEKIKEVFSKYFETIWLSYEKGVLKPSDEFYMGVLKDLSVKPEETVVIGDEPFFDLYPAKRLGMIPVHLERKHKTKISDAPKEKFITVRNLKEFKEFLMKREE